LKSWAIGDEYFPTALESVGLSYLEDTTRGELVNFVSDVNSKLENHLSPWASVDRKSVRRSKEDEEDSVLLQEAPEPHYIH